MEDASKKKEDKQNAFVYSHVLYMMLAVWLLWYFKIFDKVLRFHVNLLKKSVSNLKYVTIFDDFDGDPLDRFNYRDNMKYCWAVVVGTMIGLGLIFA